MTRINKSGVFIRIISGFGPVLGLLLVIGVFSLLVDTPGRLLSPNNLRIVLSQTVIVAIGAIGMTLIIISGGIDLAVGSTIALTGVVTALAINVNQLHGIVVQNPFNMGYLGVRTMVDSLLGKQVDKKIDTGVMLVTKENLQSPEVNALLHPPLDQYLK